MWKCNGHCGFVRRMAPAEVEARRAAELIETWEARRAEARAELWRRRGVDLREDLDCDQGLQAEGVGDGSSSGSDEECLSEQEGQGEEEEHEDDSGAMGLGALSRMALKRICIANHLLVSGNKSILHERLRLASEHGRSGACPRCCYSQVELVCPAHEPNVPCQLDFAATGVARTTDAAGRGAVVVKDGARARDGDFGRKHLIFTVRGPCAKYHHDGPFRRLGAFPGCKPVSSSGEHSLAPRSRCPIRH